MAHEMTQIDILSCLRWWALGFAAACVAACGTSSTGSDQAGPDAEGVDASVDSGARPNAPSDAADAEREASPPIVPLALVPDSPLVYQSPTEVSLPDAEQGSPYLQIIQVRAGTGVAPYHLTFSGQLPAGFAAIVEHDDAVNADVAVLGIPADIGVNHFVVDLADASGAKLATSFAFRVVETKATILPATPPTARAGVAGYETTFEAKDGTPPLVWSASGLPVGMSIDPTTGVLSGVPDETAGDHDVQLAVTVIDSLRDASTNAAAGRSVSRTTQLHVDPGYRANVLALLISYGCHYCHGDIGNSVYYKPRIAGIPTPPKGQENASGLVGEHPGGIAGDGHITVCEPSRTYVIPGDPDNSLLYQKITGTLANPPPCGSCMPYQGGTCNNEPTVSIAGRDLVRHWIMSLPPAPSAKDLE
jgi:hypothetical protein